jgi:hypothetical protein
MMDALRDYKQQRKRLPFVESVALLISLCELNGRISAVAHPVFRGTACRH